MTEAVQTWEEHSPSSRLDATTYQLHYPEQFVTIAAPHVLLMKIVPAL